MTTTTQDKSRGRIAAESWGRFVGYVPEMRRKGFAVVWSALVVGMGLVMLAGSAWLSRSFPWGGLVAQMVWLAGLYGTAYLGFWRGRVAYRARYGDDAYRQLFLRYVGPTLALLIAAAWLPLVVGSGAILSWGASRGIAAYLFTSGGLISARGRELFWNIDLRGFVYSVYPERGGWVTSPLFDQLRHPIYSAATRWILGLAVLRNNPESLLCGGLLALGFVLWARLEDVEMTRRFPAYADYRRTVPALFVVRPSRVWSFYHYLLTAHADAPRSRDDQPSTQMKLLS